MVLFDPSSTYLYVFVKFALGLDMVYDMLDSHVYVSTLIRDLAVVIQ